MYNPCQMAEQNAWSYTGKKITLHFLGAIILRVCNLQKDSTMTHASTFFRLSEWSFSAAPLAQDVHSTFFGLYRQVDSGLPKLDVPINGRKSMIFFSWGEKLL